MPRRWLAPGSTAPISLEHALLPTLPARALLEAKKEFLAGIPHRPGPVAKAIEMKIFRQYTCLGLGW